MPPKSLHRGYRNDHASPAAGCLRLTKAPVVILVSDERPLNSDPLLLPVHITPLETERLSWPESSDEQELPEGLPPISSNRLEEVSSLPRAQGTHLLSDHPSCVARSTSTIFSMRKLLSGSGPAGAGPDSPGSCDDEHSQGASSFFPGLSTLPGPLTPFYTNIATLPSGLPLHTADKVCLGIRGRC